MSGTSLAILALALAAGTTTLWFRRALGVRLPRNRAGFLAGWLGAALLGVGAFVQGAGLVGGIAAGIAIVAACFCCFTVAISRQQVASDAIRVGAPLPAFSAPDANGESWEFTGTPGHPVLLKFFRGHW